MFIRLGQSSPPSHIQFGASRRSSQPTEPPTAEIEAHWKSLIGDLPNDELEKFRSEELAKIGQSRPSSPYNEHFARVLTDESLARQSQTVTAHSLGREQDAKKLTPEEQAIVDKIPEKSFENSRLTKKQVGALLVDISKQDPTFETYNLTQTASRHSISPNTVKSWVGKYCEAAGI
jgi:hypothetical protein